MEKLYEDEENRDVWFLLDDGKKYGGHRVVLMNSDVEWFSTILKSSFRESKEKTISVKDVESFVFEIALKYAYGIVSFDGRFIFNRESVLPIFKAASHFLCKNLIEKLRDRCANSAKIVFIDCGLQFGDEFLNYISAFDISIENSIKYFNKIYSDEEERQEFMQKFFDISSIKEGEVYNYLNETGVAETLDLKIAERFLKIINYTYRMNANSATFPLLLCIPNKNKN